MHPYLQHAPEGRAVVDSVLAARHVAPQRPPFTGGDFVYAAYALYITASVHLFAPSVQYTDLLSLQLAAQIPAARQLCLIDLINHLMALHPPLNSIILNPRGTNNPGLLRFIAQVEPAQRRSQGPILLLQGDRDEPVPVQATNLLKGELCRLGNVVEYRTYPTADHDTILTQAYPAMLQWLRDRLRGRPPRQTCPARPAPPPVPVTG